MPTSPKETECRERQFTGLDRTFETKKLNLYPDYAPYIMTGLLAIASTPQRKITPPSCCFETETK